MDDLNPLINIDTNHHYRMIVSRLREGMPVGLSASECWPWRWKRGPGGDDYGKIYYVDEIGRRCCVSAARALLWALGKCELRGRGVHSRHSCDHPWCINPEHIEAGTPAQNVADMRDRGRAIDQTGGPKRKSSRVRKLTDDQVREIRRWQGRPTDIARKLGIAPNTASDIMRRKTKTLVPD